MMNTKLLMISSSVVMGAIGILFSFLPQEMLSYVQVSPDGITPLFLQVAGAMYIALAMINWMTRAAAIGGIYNRAIAMGNVIHFTIGALALAKGLSTVPVSAGLIVATAAYTVFAVWFGIVLFKHPGTTNQNK